MVWLEEFLLLAGQIFLIICIESIIEIMVANKKQTYLLKPIELASYIACLFLVIRFTQLFMKEIISAVLQIF